MAKLTLSDLAFVDQTAPATINANNDAIEEAMEKTLSRDGTSPNAMESDLDMNSNRILNLAEAIQSTEPIRKEEFDAIVAAILAALEAGGGGGGGNIGDALTTDPLSQFAATTSAQLAGVISDETGTGALVFGTSPTLVTPNLGTPSAINLANATNFPVGSLGGLGTGVAAALAGAVLTDPDADRILFWDDSAGGIRYLTAGTGLSISGTTISVTGSISSLAIVQGTITDPALMLSGTVTWNDPSDTFVAWRLDVSSLGSAAASILLDLRVGEDHKFRVRKDGAIFLNVSTAPNIYMDTTLDFGTNVLWLNGWTSGKVNIGLNQGWGLVYQSTGITVDKAAHHIGWSTAGLQDSGNMDLTLARDAAGTLAIRNTADGTIAQAQRIYRTYSSGGTNYERLALQTGAGYMELAAETAGTGTDDIDVQLTPAGSGKVKFGTHSAIAAETLSGYILIKDAAGNSRKVGIVS